MKIICVGRNFSEHAAELKNELPTEPVLFIKPDTAVLKPNQNFYHPPFSQDIHHECEVFFRIGKKGRYIKRQFAALHIDSIGLGIDFTARDLQAQQKQKGLPWEIAKAFNSSAPISPFYPLEQFPDWDNINFRLEVNGETRQVGNTRDMIFKIDFLIEYISQYFTLKTGDLIFCGTPAGVARVQPGDHLVGYLESTKAIDFYVR